MADLSDPTALSTKEREEIDRALDGFTTGALSIYDVMKAVPHPYNAVADMTNQWAHDFVNWAFSLKKKLDRSIAERAALATELDGLRAQIEEIRKATSDHKLADGEPSEFAGFEEGLDRGASIRSQSIRRILAQSPRGTVARIQAEALTAVDARIQRQMDAEEKKEPTPSSTGHWSGLAEAQQLLRAALRERAGK